MVRCLCLPGLLYAMIPPLFFLYPKHSTGKLLFVKSQAPQATVKIPTALYREGLSALLQDHIRLFLQLLHCEKFQRDLNFLLFRFLPSVLPLI